MNIQRLCLSPKHDSQKMNLINLLTNANVNATNTQIYGKQHISKSKHIC